MNLYAKSQARVKPADVTDEVWAESDARVARLDGLLASLRDAIIAQAGGEDELDLEARYETWYAARGSEAPEPSPIADGRRILVLTFGNGKSQIRYFAPKPKDGEPYPDDVNIEIPETGEVYYRFYSPPVRAIAVVDAPFAKLVAQAVAGVGGLFREANGEYNTNALFHAHQRWSVDEREAQGVRDAAEREETAQTTRAANAQAAIDEAQADADAAEALIDAAQVVIDNLLAPMAEVAQAVWDKNVSITPFAEAQARLASAETDLADADAQIANAETRFAAFARGTVVELEVCNAMDEAALAHLEANIVTYASVIANVING